MDTAVIFPGQGTQQPGMGVAWRDHEAWGVVERAEAALGEPLAPLLLDAPAETLARTREAQLAVLLTSLVIWEAARGAVDQPVAFAGHSLGQVTALIAAGVMTLEDGVQLAARRAELTQAAADAHPGPDGRAARRHRRDRGGRVHRDARCGVARERQRPGQVVIAGTPEGVDAGVARQGARRAQGDAAQRRRRVPHAADARRGRWPRARPRRRHAAHSDGARRLERRRPGV